MVHTLFPNEVYLEPIEHKYFDGQGNQYISFSALYGKLVRKFDANFISKQVAKSSSLSANEVRAIWEQTAINGTRIDGALERYAQSATLIESDEDLKELVEDVLTKYKCYNSTFEQGVPYCKKYRVAGSWDKLCLVSNRKDSKFHLSDFKCFNKGLPSLFEIKGQSFLNAPFEHLPNTKYTKISFQLSYYAFLFEQLTGRKCERLFIDLITPKWNGTTLESYTNEVVPVIYLKNDIKIFLETFKDDILKDLDNTLDVFATEQEEIF